jgi:hypothetical protein
MSAGWQRNGSRRGGGNATECLALLAFSLNHQLFASSPSPSSHHLRSESLFYTRPSFASALSPKSNFFVPLRSPSFSFAFPRSKNPSAMFSRSAFSALFLSIALVALADVTPTDPGPGQVFQAGAACAIAWTPDTTGTWKTLNIELMTGDNINMVHLTSSCCYIFRVIVV